MMYPPELLSSNSMNVTPTAMESSAYGICLFCDPKTAVQGSKMKFAMCPTSLLFSCCRKSMCRLCCLCLRDMMQRKILPKVGIEWPLFDAFNDFCSNNQYELYCGVLDTSIKCPCCDIFVVDTIANAGVEPSKFAEVAKVPLEWDSCDKLKPIFAGSVIDRPKKKPKPPPLADLSK
jgi:hypothetical protein